MPYLWGSRFKCFHTARVIVVSFYKINDHCINILSLICQIIPSLSLNNIIYQTSYLVNGMSLTVVCQWKAELCCWAGLEWHEFVHEHVPIGCILEAQNSELVSRIGKMELASLPLIFTGLK